MKITTPLENGKINKLKIGDRVLITGVIYTARDIAHLRMFKLLKDKKELPFDLKGQIIFYAGPCPSPPGRPIGSIGPTTSSRMDSFTPMLLDMGLKGMIGKGDRSEEVIKSIKKNKAVYFITYAGAAAYLSMKVKSSRVVAFDDLGTEAIYRLEVEDFPTVVVIDSKGNNIFKKGGSDEK